MNRLVVIFLCCNLASVKAEAGHLKDKIRSAREAYAEWKSDNHELDRNFKRQAAKFKLKLQNDVYLQDELNQFRISSSDDKSARLRQIVHSAFENEFFNVGCNNGTSRVDHLSWNAILMGQSKLSCQKDLWVSERRIGPGLGITFIDSVAYICAAPIKGIQVGPSASVAAVLGLRLGMLFGQSGVCMLVAFDFGFDAFAGFSIVEFSSTTPW